MWACASGSFLQARKSWNKWIDVLMHTRHCAEIDALRRSFQDQHKTRAGRRVVLALRRMQLGRAGLAFGQWARAAARAGRSGRLLRWCCVRMSLARVTAAWAAWRFAVRASRAGAAAGAAVWRCLGRVSAVRLARAWGAWARVWVGQGRAGEARAEAERLLREKSEMQTR